MPDSNREWVFAERPEGEPDMDSFALHERDVPDPDPGELLVRVQYLSVDPYMRGRMRDRASYAEPWEIGDTLNGAVVGEVVESTSDAYEAGDLVTGTGAWADYSLLDADSVTRIRAVGSSGRLLSGRCPDTTTFRHRLRRLPCYRCRGQRQPFCHQTARLR